MGLKQGLQKRAGGRVGDEMAGIADLEAAARRQRIAIGCVWPVAFKALAPVHMLFKDTLMGLNRGRPEHHHLQVRHNDGFGRFLRRAVTRKQCFVHGESLIGQACMAEEIGDTPHHTFLA
jgi:hypothetical protein